MQLAHERFSIERIAVVGGGHICGGFLSSGLVDEVSAMVAPGIDGRKAVSMFGKHKTRILNS